MKGTALIEIEDLSLHYKVEDGWVRAVDDVSISIERGRTYGLVGESGCGKTTVAWAITQLLPPNAHILGGSVLFDETDLLGASRKSDGTLDDFNEEIRKVRWKEISMIFQGAMDALNPVQTVGSQIEEAVLTHEDVTDEEARQKGLEVFDIVGIPEDRYDSYPHEYSGGMRQRAMIAMALVLNPSVLIADEPTTALDVIMQDRILGEIKKLQDKYNIAMIIITHDISVVAETSDEIFVMYAGKIVETGKTRDVFKTPSHPYTEGLLGSFPSITGPKRQLVSIPGNPPDLVSPPSACRFHPRCRYAKDICREVEPEMVTLATGQRSACHFAEELFGKMGVAK
ncbi:MAG: ABC transporter ATP-binding protein [Thermoplasmata archaeon]